MMAPIAAVSADITIAISLSGDDPEARGREPRPTAEWLNRMWRSTSSLLDTKTARTLLDSQTARTVLSRFSAGDDGEAESAGADAAASPIPRLGGFEVMNRTIDIAQAALARHTLAAYPPDLLIEVPRTVCRSLDFHRADEVIEIGQELAVVALDALEAGRSGG